MSSIEQTATLLEDVFPGSRIGTAEYLKWLYQDSPFGPVIESNLDDDLGRAAHYALVPMAVECDGVPAMAALSLNTAVAVRARGGGTFVRLASEAIAEARERGCELVLGVANANSTPGFIRRLDFSLLGHLPAHIIVPSPVLSPAFRSAWMTDKAFHEGGIAAEIEGLFAAPSSGVARVWSSVTLRWRLSQPGAKYGLHRSREVFAVSCLDRRGGLRIAVLLKVFSASPISKRTYRGVIAAICRFHRAPLALHVGYGEARPALGISMPTRARPSPLNLIYRDLTERLDAVSVARFELLDFDAY